MLYCSGKHCPLRFDCYRHTQPNRGRDAFSKEPYDATTASCQHYISNLPSEELIRQTAYFIWQRQGCPEDQSQSHWEEAFVSLCQSTGRLPR